ncbi:MAG TPA: hypothetical protein DEF45_11430 [Rhodopirellula sp.]|nr:hypothetical protein [Rhodopirellula sp.]
MLRINYNTIRPHFVLGYMPPAPETLQQTHGWFRYVPAGVCFWKTYDQFTNLRTGIVRGGRPLFGSNLGNARKHDTRNMPILLAGGGFCHGQHLAFDQRDNYPLKNLFVSMLEKLVLKIDHFVSSTRTMGGLAPA